MGDQVRHQFRFSVDYLIREGLLTTKCEPIGIAGLVSHLYWTEPSNLALASLLKDGVFHRICKDFIGSPEGGVRREKITFKLLLILSHLFGRRFLHASVQARARKKPAPSKVVLEDPPKKIVKLLEE